jgi:hypothetical protein
MIHTSYFFFSQFVLIPPRRLPSSNPNPRSCSCKIRSLLIILLVTSFLSLYLVGYQNHVWFLNRTMVLELILPFDVCSSSPKVDRSVVTCILLVNSQAWQSVLIVSVLVLSSLPESFFIRSQFISINNISSYCYWCVVRAWLLYSRVLTICVQ